MIWMATKEMEVERGLRNLTTKALQLWVRLEDQFINCIILILQQLVAKQLGH